MPRAPKVEFFTVTEMCEKVGMSGAQVRKLCRDGIIPHAVLRGHLWIIPVQDVDHFIEFRGEIRNQNTGRKLPYRPRFRKDSNSKDLTDKHQAAE